MAEKIPSTYIEQTGKDKSIIDQLVHEIQNDLQKLFQTVLTLQVASKGRRQHFEELSQIVGDALLFHAERAGDLLSGVVARVPVPVQRMSITP